MAGNDIVKLGDMSQVGIVVRDADKVIEAWSSTFGFSNWRYVDRSGTDAKGRSFKYKVAHSKFGPIDFELIQPIEGRIVQSRLLETYGEAIHHIAFPVPNVAEATAQLEGRPGIKVVFKGDPFCYIEIPGGVTIELVPQR